jgi:uncharacterized protein (DUF1499 family)
VRGAGIEPVRVGRIFGVPVITNDTIWQVLFLIQKNHSKILLIGINEMSDPQLKPCPESPNCVSTQTQQKSKRMDPIPFELEPKEVLKIIKSVVESLPNTHLEKESLNYLHYTFKSRIFRFIDDVEFLIDLKQKLIHFRSASRTGYSDMGVNKKRMTEITKAIKHEMESKGTSR